jgi:hypothetical protein
MPCGGKSTAGISSGIFTEDLPGASVINTVSFSAAKQHRNRPLKERAVRKTYSFYSRTINGLERYADDNGMTYSQVINLALRQLIPRSYFEDEE